MSLFVLHRPLWAEVEATWPDADLTSTTRRYRVSLAALKTKLGQGERGLKIGDLKDLDWKGLKATWGKSGSDWNHLRRAVSALLTRRLGSEHHPFRLAVLERIPTATEAGRVPDLTPQLYWKVFDQLPEHARPGIMTLVATGMRMSEYLRCTKAHLQPATRGIRVPGQKTAESSASIPVADWLWPWIEKGIPAPLGQRWLRMYWIRACKAAGVPPVTLHDLRHCFGQWAVNAGVPESAVQTALRHASAAMTRRYTKQKERRGRGGTWARIETGENGWLAAQSGIDTGLTHATPHSPRRQSGSAPTPDRGAPELGGHSGGARRARREGHALRVAPRASTHPGGVARPDAGGRGRREPPPVASRQQAGPPALTLKHPSWSKRRERAHGSATMAGSKREIPNITNAKPANASRRARARGAVPQSLNSSLSFANAIFFERTKFL